MKALVISLLIGWATCVGMYDDDNEVWLSFPYENRECKLADAVAYVDLVSTSNVVEVGKLRCRYAYHNYNRGSKYNPNWVVLHVKDCEVKPIVPPPPTPLWKD